jgi:hypothetical protein
MIMHNRNLPFNLALTLASGLALCAPQLAFAQQLSPEWSPLDDGAGTDSGGTVQAESAEPRGERSGPRVSVTPYIEAQQLLVADLKDGGDVLTYSTVSVGVDATIQTRRAEAQINMRYERLISYDNNLQDQNIVSGLARGSVKIARGLSFEAGGVATRSKVDGRGASPSNLVGNPDNITQVYSVYAGPTFSTQAGPLSINAAYRAGYTKVDSHNVGTLPTGQNPVAVFDDSVSHSATASIGMQPGVLPIGWSASVGYDREDAGQLDQRYEGKFGRLDVTVPISSALAAVGGVGYEKIKVSERDGIRDSFGAPVLDSKGRYATNPSSPRLTAYESDGIIWDAGVLWRPSNRTSVTGTFGHRYGTDTYSGSLSYQPNNQWAVNVSVYDSVSGFGNMLNNSLSNMPTKFNSPRNPLSGDIGGCAFGQSGAFCFNDALQTASSAAFRSRGVSASLSGKIGGWETGYAVGYNRRQFLASNIGAQANISGLVDQNYYAVAYLGRELDSQSRFDTNVYANYFDPGFLNAPNVLAVGMNAAYYRQIIRGLSATAAVGLDSYRQESFDSALTGSALLGLRYSF